MNLRRQVAIDLFITACAGLLFCWLLVIAFGPRYMHAASRAEAAAMEARCSGLDLRAEISRDGDEYHVRCVP